MVGKCRMHCAHDVFVLCLVVQWLWLNWHHSVGVLYRCCRCNCATSCRVLLLELLDDLWKLFIRDKMELRIDSHLNCHQLFVARLCKVIFRSECLVEYAECPPHPRCRCCISACFLVGHCNFCVGIGSLWMVKP